MLMHKADGLQLHESDAIDLWRKGAALVWCSEKEAGVLKVQKMRNRARQDPTKAAEACALGGVLRLTCQLPYPRPVAHDV